MVYSRFWLVVVGKEASLNLFSANCAITRHCGHSPGIPRSMTQEMT